MITVTLNRTEFEYDIHSLIKAFFPKEDVELYYTMGYTDRYPSDEDSDADA